MEGKNQWSRFPFAETGREMNPIGPFDAFVNQCFREVLSTVAGFGI
jgi:hypothetical protein